ncbi:hypothetical protein Q2K19_12610 [Micromonospora soli]|uniref:hypothetical protein n=1 Tax=Micromonospora sp. NBRC 110009 TaxID=3061627 RepID=UPI002672CF97|nr:hypothetical protein [Micromonospora sp. NBRC 110009]WKU01242.1 hypothetical protein Q2K19_12610 [Micromonospora sp. NBRC 110009]
MSSFPKPDARVKAAAASLAAVAALVTLLVWHPPGILSVALALLCILLGMIAGVAVSALRQGGGAPVEEWTAPGTLGGDADTLEALDPRTIRELRTAAEYGVDADTLEALDPRDVREQRAVNGLSDR